MTNTTYNKKQWYECVDVWGPHYWFVLHTIVKNYPNHPTDVTKKKYYDFIQNIPIFIPYNIIGDSFSELLDRYPVTPYMDSRESFMKWMNFIHNKINLQLNKPKISFQESQYIYLKQYIESMYPTKTPISYYYKNIRRLQLYLVTFSLLFAIVYFLYNE